MKSKISIDKLFESDDSGLSHFTGHFAAHRLDNLNSDTKLGGRWKTVADRQRDEDKAITAYDKKHGRNAWHKANYGSMPHYPGHWSYARSNPKPERKRNPLDQRFVDLFKEGDKVKLRANPEEGWDEEFGTVLGIDFDTMVVQLDSPQDNDDDSIREVSFDQVEPVN